MRLFAGSRFDVNNNWGIVFDLDYFRGITDSDNNQFAFTYDEMILQQFAQDIQNTDAMSISIGLSYKF
jgi:hypothetical protein